MIGEYAALTTALLWSWTALLFTSAGRLVGSFIVSQTRLMLGGIFLLITYHIIGGDYSITNQELIALILSGIIGLLVGDLALFKAFTIIGARRGMLIMALAPALTGVLAYFFLNEILGWAAMSGIAITLFGIYWVVAEPKEKQDPIHGSMALGVMMAALGAASQAVSLVIAKHALNNPELDALYATLIRMAAAFSVSFILMFFRKRSMEALKVFRNKKVMFFLLLGSITGPFLGVWFSMVSIKYTQTGVGATIMSTTPILIIPFSIIFHKEKPSWRAIMGTVIAVVGVVVLFWQR